MKRGGQPISKLALFFKNLYQIIPYFNTFRTLSHDRNVSDKTVCEIRNHFDRLSALKPLFNLYVCSILQKSVLTSLILVFLIAVHFQSEKKWPPLYFGQNYIVHETVSFEQRFFWHGFKVSRFCRDFFFKSNFGFFSNQFLGPTSPMTYDYN